MSVAGPLRGNILRGLCLLLVVPTETSSGGITLERVWRSLVGADTKSEGRGIGNEGSSRVSRVKRARFGSVEIYIYLKGKLIYRVD